MPVKTMNSVADIYEGKVLKVTSDGFECPVCKKVYKREGSAENHLTEQECYDVKSLVKNTEREKKALKLFAAIMADVNPNTRVSITYFRKSKLYGQIVKFSMFCSLFEIRNPELYFAWIRDIKRFKHANAIISNALKEENMYEYRRWLRQNPEFIDNATYVSQNEEWIDMEHANYDIHFLIRSFEKSHLSLEYYCQYYGVDVESVLTVNSEYHMRLVALLNEKDD